MPELPYAVDAWCADAALVRIAWEKVHNDNLHQDLRDILFESDKHSADAALHTLEPAARQSASARAVLNANKPSCSINNAQALSGFLERFRNGPNVWYNAPEPERHRNDRAPSLRHTPTTPCLVCPQ